jgi:HD-like signal output (HDOD) protein
MKAIFVDESPQGLGELKRLVEAGRMGLAAAFASRAEDAALWMDASGFEVIVGSVRRPRDEAAQALRLAEAQHPNLARLAIIHPPARQDDIAGQMFLHHPLTVDKLRRAMLATLRWRERLGSACVTDLINGVRKLPSLPDAFIALRRELESPDPSVQRAAECVRRDPALSIKVLQLVNSALFGLRRQVGDVGQAAALLGLDSLATVVLGAGILQFASNLDRRYIEVLWRDSLRVAELARKIADTGGLARSDIEDAQLAGIIHDVGEMVLFSNWPQQFVQIDLDQRDEEERSRFGATHGDIGGFLCAVWELPPLVIEAVTHHHHPSQSAYAKVLSPVTAVHVARALVDAGGDMEKAALDMDHIDAIGGLRFLQSLQGVAA